jgi:thiamine pyrophosphokinase
MGNAQRQALIITGSGPLSDRGAELCTAAAARGAAVIAADGGLDTARSADLEPGYLVGDLDSISAAGRMWAYAHGVDIEEHPADKDATDTELAVARALKLEVSSLLIVAGESADARFDHQLGLVAALGHASLGSLVRVHAHIAGSDVWVVHAGRSIELAGAAGRTFSTMVLHGNEAEVSIAGARYPLDHEVLTAGTARGISNVGVASDVSIVCHRGITTVVMP